jgi:hypothetical protein
MPFLHKTELDLKNRFWTVNPTEPGLIIDRGGRKWPDFLGHGGGAPGFFVSSRVVDALRKIGAPIARTTVMPIAKISAKALTRQLAPVYCVVETVPGIEVDLLASGFKVDASGRAILNPPPKPWPSPYRYRLNSWNGADLFSYQHFGPTDGPYTELFCSERIKELSENEGWTNVRFKALEIV